MSEANSITNAINAHHEKNTEPPRPYLECSQIGHPCDRWLWLNFRWAVREKFTGRMLRLFRRGHKEEATVIEDLRAIGIDVRHTGAHQSAVDLNWHVRGHVDGIIKSGVPGAERVQHVLEIKTHHEESFHEVKEKGVKQAKPMHWAQMQMYMLGTQSPWALYVAVNKDDDKLYTERVPYDEKEAAKLLARAHRITSSDRMPPPISTDPSWHQCRYCPAHKFCHETKCIAPDAVHCRTCAHVTPTPVGTWKCERYDGYEVPVENQRMGCDVHTLHPDLVPWKPLDGLDQWTAVYEIDGRPVANGEADAHIYTSTEILANPSACASGDAEIAKLRTKFNGRVVG